MATRVGSAYFDVTFNTTAARRELTALVGAANRQFGLLGGVGLVGATVAVGALASATVDLGKAALTVATDYEQAFARVRKTVDDGSLTAAEATQVFGELDQQLRDMALEVPLDLSSEIAEVAALAGQLGIPIDQIEEFTRVISEVGVTTNIAVDDAATGFARLANIMGTPESQFRAVADAVVHLGNRLPTTEDEILRFSLRIAAAGEIVGFTEKEVLAMSAAMSSVGIPAERGGTAMQRTLIKISEAVATTSGDLELFGAVAGLTAEQFAQLWEQDASEAFTRFVEGLGRSGDQAFTILADLNLAEQRTLQALLSIANAGPLLRDSFQLAAESAGATARESEIFFSTTAANIQLLGNTIQNAGIRIGTEMQDPFNEIIDLTREWIRTNPELIDQIGHDLTQALEHLIPVAEDLLGILGSVISFASGAAADVTEVFQRGVSGDEFGATVIDFLQEIPVLGQGAIDVLTGIADVFTFGRGTELFGGKGLADLTLVEAGLRSELEKGVDQFEAVTGAIIELDDRLRPLGVSISELGFNELINEVDLTDEQIRALIRDLTQMGIQLPVAVQLLGQDFALTGPGGSGFGPTIEPLSNLETRRAQLEHFLELESDAAEQAEAFADALESVEKSASELGVPVSVLLDNLSRLAPELQPLVNEFGAAEIEATLFRDALNNLQNSLDFDMSDVTDEFELLLEVTNKAGDEVPATMRQIITDLQEQADRLADLEAATTILDVLGFGDLAAELRDQGPEAAGAAVDFVNNIERAIEAENILDTGGRISDDLLAGMQEALETGTITPELLELVEQFTSETVKQSVANQARELGGLFGLELLAAIDLRTDIKIPVNLIPEIIQGVPNPAGPTTRTRVPGTVLEMNFNSPSISTTDVARATQIAGSLVN